MLLVVEVVEVVVVVVGLFTRISACTPEPSKSPKSVPPF